MSAACCLGNNPDGWTRHSVRLAMDNAGPICSRCLWRAEEAKMIIISLSVTLSYFQSTAAKNHSSRTKASRGVDDQPREVKIKYVEIYRLTQSLTAAFFLFIRFTRDGRATRATTDGIN